MGDYRNPPPEEKYKVLHAYSRSLLKHDPVKIDQHEVSECILHSLVDRLHQFTIPVAIGAFDGIHGHLLIQCRSHNPRIVIGIAKQYATAQLKARGYAVALNLQPGEGIWARSSHSRPITGPKHYQRTFNYIADHARRGAAVLVPT